MSGKYRIADRLYRGDPCGGGWSRHTSSPCRTISEPVAELMRCETTVAQLCVDAAVEGDRQKALKCLLLDQVVTDIEVAKQILDDYLTSYKEYLPQFWK
jgi:alpha-galactosidase/6-phospho-beta-glucosidase family protein